MFYLRKFLQFKKRVGQGGVSLVNTLVSAGVLSISAAAISQYYSAERKQSQVLQAISRRPMFESQLRGALSNPQNISYSADNVSDPKNIELARCLGRISGSVCKGNSNHTFSGYNTAKNPVERISSSTGLPYTVTGERTTKSGKSCGTTPTVDCPVIVSTTFQPLCLNRNTLTGNTETDGSCRVASAFKITYRAEMALDASGNKFKSRELGNLEFPTIQDTLMLDARFGLDMETGKCPVGHLEIGRDLNGLPKCDPACAKGYFAGTEQIKTAAGQILIECKLGQQGSRECVDGSVATGIAADGTLKCQRVCPGGYFKTGSKIVDGVSKPICSTLKNFECPKGTTFNGFQRGSPVCISPGQRNKWTPNKPIADFRGCWKQPDAGCPPGQINIAAAGAKKVCVVNPFSNTGTGRCPAGSFMVGADQPDCEFKCRSSNSKKSGAKTICELECPKDPSTGEVIVVKTCCRY
jgi:hypothetical protein